jgi:putative ABC transport system permease protein
MNALLFGWIAWGEWRAYPVRVALSVLAIAVGVSLGFAVHLVNRAALGEMASALNTVAGSADLQIVSVEPSGFDEELFATLAARPEIAAASPVIERSVALAAGRGTLDIQGIDVLRAAAVTPALIPNPDASARERLFDTDSLYLSPAAQAALSAKPGAFLDILANGRSQRLAVAGTLGGARAGESLGMMDIGAAQWRLGLIGRLSRIDLKLNAGVSPETFTRVLETLVPEGVRIVTPRQRDARTDSLSRAYRVNLDMLALMALFTGAFLVYSTQSLSVARRAAQGALLRVIGLPRRALVLQVVLEGALLGVAGSLLGLVLGLALAGTALHWLGGDLGGGYFTGMHPHLVITPWAGATFFVLGLAAALFGSFLPARTASRVQPAIALKSGSESGDPRARPVAFWAVGALVLGALCAMLPALDGLAVFGYLSMALLLFGGIALMPWLAHALLGPLIRHAPRQMPLTLDLALKRLWGAPTQAAVALCGIVAATSLMVAMGIMVTSFRESVDAWVERLLPAELYLHITGPIESVGLDLATEERLAGLPGVGSIEFLRTLPLQLSPSQPPVVLLARSIPPEGPGATLQLVAEQPAPAGAIPVWISEAVVDLYGVRLGQTLSLPLPDAAGMPRGVRVFVAGVWRDYARQAGSIVMRETDYTALTGDHLRSDAGVRTSAGADLGELSDRIRAVLPEAVAAHAELARPAQIRATSLRIFDRSFAVTYVLEGVAIVIGLLGVAATFSAQTVARAREFGMLRHVGVLRVQIVRMLCWEGALLGLLGVAAGLLVGLAMSQVLIHVVNPQSFHWSMDTHIPWLLLGTVGMLLLAASAGTAVLAGREALSGAAILAVREDW